MIEKLLRRFVSEDTEYVLKAMEQVGADPKLDDFNGYPRLKQYEEMYYARLKAQPRFPDEWVLVEVYLRLNKERVRLTAAAKAQKIASQFFMGETFEDKKTRGTAQSAVPASLVPGIQQLAAQQQGQRLPQTSAGQRGSGDLL